MTSGRITALACALSLLASLGGGMLAAPNTPAPAQRLAGARPTRIVSLALPADELLLAMVTPTRIAALESFVDDPHTSNATDAARAVPGRLGQPLVAEELLALRPDLVLLPGWSDPQLGALLELEGVAVIRLASPESIADVEARIRDVAHAVHETAAGEALVTEFRARLGAVRARGARRAHRPTVLLAAWSEQSPAAGTLFCEVVEIAGGVCETARDGRRGYVPMPLEALLQRDPDVLVVDAYRADARARDVVPERDFRSDPRHGSLRAVREGRVLTIAEAHLLATSHHVASLAESLADGLDRAYGAP